MVPIPISQLGLPHSNLTESGHIIVATGKGTVSVKIDVPTIREIFQRALNTYSDISPELYEFSDNLNKL